MSNHMRSDVELCICIVMSGLEGADQVLCSLMKGKQASRHAQILIISAVAVRDGVEVGAEDHSKGEDRKGQELFKETPCPNLALQYTGSQERTWQ